LKKVSSMRSIPTLMRTVLIAATLAVSFMAGAVGCSPRKPERDPRPPAVPVVEESYAIDEANRPLTEEELDAAFALLETSPADFLADLEKAPPVRQASLIFVLQRDPSIARERRALLEKLSASEHGIVRRAALFALEAAEDETAPLP
jgi:hypothetical protein